MSDINNLFNKNIPQFTSKRLIRTIKPKGLKMNPTVYKKVIRPPVENSMTQEEKQRYLIVEMNQPLAKIMDKEHQKSVSKQKNIDFLQVPYTVKTNTILKKKYI